MDRDGRSTAVALAMGVAGAVLLIAALAVFSSSSGYGYDLAAYLSAAARVAAGGTPYQPQTLNGPFSPGPAGLYLYPPPLAVLLAAVSGVATATVEAGWWIVRVGLLVVGCAALPVPRWVRGGVLLALAVSYPTLIDLNLGNVSLLVLVASCLAWRWLDRPASGLATALALALRPTLIVVPIWWLIRRQWQPLAWTIGAGLVLIVLTLPFVGHRWVHGLPDGRAQPVERDRGRAQRGPGLGGAAGRGGIGHRPARPHRAVRDRRGGHRRWRCGRIARSGS